jgi:hypothetical protein
MFRANHCAQRLRDIELHRAEARRMDVTPPFRHQRHSSRSHERPLLLTPLCGLRWCPRWSIRSTLCCAPAPGRTTTNQTVNARQTLEELLANIARRYCTGEVLTIAIHLNRDVATTLGTTPIPTCLASPSGFSLVRQQSRVPRGKPPSADSKSSSLTFRGRCRRSPNGDVTHDAVEATLLQRNGVRPSPRIPVPCCIQAG